jgi:hypothetical protein
MIYPHRGLNSQQILWPTRICWGPEQRFGRAMSGPEPLAQGGSAQIAPAAPVSRDVCCPREARPEGTHSSRGNGRSRAAVHAAVSTRNPARSRRCRADAGDYREATGLIDASSPRQQLESTRPLVASPNVHVLRGNRTGWLLTCLSPSATPQNEILRSAGSVTFRGSGFPGQVKTRTARRLRREIAGGRDSCRHDAVRIQCHVEQLVAVADAARLRSGRSLDVRAAY